MLHTCTNDSAAASTAKRVLRQLRRDPRIVALLIAVPTLLLILVRYAFDSQPDLARHCRRYGERSVGGGDGPRRVGGRVGDAAAAYTVTIPRRAVRVAPRHRSRLCDRYPVGENAGLIKAVNDAQSADDWAEVDLRHASCVVVWNVNVDLSWETARHVARDWYSREYADRNSSTRSGSHL